MFKVTFKFENGEDVTTFAQEGEILLEVARKTNVATFFIVLSFPYGAD